MWGLRINFLGTSFINVKTTFHSADAPAVQATHKLLAIAKMRIVCYGEKEQCGYNVKLTANAGSMKPVFICYKKRKYKGKFRVPGYRSKVCVIFCTLIKGSNHLIIGRLLISQEEHMLHILLGQ